MTQELSIDLPLSNISNIKYHTKKIRRENNSQFCTQSAVCSMHFVLTGS